MSIEFHQSLLAGIQSNDPEFMQAAQSTNELTELCKEGNISPQEYIELLKDIQRKINIKQSMSELETLSKLNTAINGLISMAGAV
jgi:hypothetical protein